MTLDQIGLFAQELNAIEKAHLADQLSIIQVGTRGDKSSYNRTIRQLSS
jgi:hypothetical protein